MKHCTALIMGEVTEGSAALLFAQWQDLVEANGLKKVTVRIMSPGGAATAGFAIYDLLCKARRSGIEVTVEAYGECSSVAFLILQAGTKRFVARHCRMLIHNGLANVQSAGHVPTATLEKASTEIRRLDRLYHDIVLTRARVAASTVKKMFEDETYLTAEQAVQYGFADGVIGGK